MEHSLTNMQKRYEDLVNLRLNPYSNGTLSDPGFLDVCLISAAMS